MTPRMAGYLLCGLAMARVGSTVMASKLIATGMPPFTATALRFAIAFPILAALMRVMRTPYPMPDRRDGLLLVVQAGSGSVGYTVLLIAGMGLASAVDAGAIAGTLPAVATVLAVLVLQERPDRAMLGSIALATAGVLIVTLPLSGGATDPPLATLLGNALVLGAVGCEALFILLNKKLRMPVAPLPLSTLMAGIGLALAAGPALLEQPWLEPLPALPIACVIYYALVPTVGGFLLWYAGSMLISGAEASLMTALAPVTAVALATGSLGEPVSPEQMTGIACVLAAVLLAGLWRQGPSRTAEHRPAEPV